MSHRFTVSQRRLFDILYGSRVGGGSQFGDEFLLTELSGACFIPL